MAKKTDTALLEKEYQKKHGPKVYKGKKDYAIHMKNLELDESILRRPFSQCGDSLQKMGLESLEWHRQYQALLDEKHITILPPIGGHKE